MPLHNVGGYKDLFKNLQKNTKPDELVAVLHQGEVVLTKKQAQAAGFQGLDPSKYKNRQTIPRFQSGVGSRSTKGIPQQISSSFGSAIETAASGTGVFNTIVGDLFLLQEVTFGLSLVTQTLSKTFIESNANLEVYLTSLKTTLGTTEKATIAFNDFAKSFALQVPFFSTQDIVGVINKLAAEGFGLQSITGNLDKAGKRFQGSITQSIIDLASAFGKTPEEAVDAFISATQNRFVRIRQFGISRDILKTFGFSGQAEDSSGAAEALTRLINVRFGGITATLSKTFKGAASNVQDFFQTITQLATQKSFNRITDFLVKITENVNVLAETLGKDEAEMSASTRTFVTYLRDGVGGALDGLVSRFLKTINTLKGFIPQALAVGTALATPFLFKKVGSLGGLVGGALVKGAGFPLAQPFSPVAKAKDVLKTAGGLNPGQELGKGSQLGALLGFGLLQKVLGTGVLTSTNPKSDLSGKTIFQAFPDFIKRQNALGVTSLDEAFSKLFGGLVESSSIPDNRKATGPAIAKGAQDFFNQKPLEFLDDTFTKTTVAASILGTVLKTTLLFSLFEITQAFEDMSKGFNETAKVLQFKELKRNLLETEKLVTKIFSDIGKTINNVFNSADAPATAALNLFLGTGNSFLRVIGQASEGLSNLTGVIRGVFNAATGPTGITIGAGAGITAGILGLAGVVKNPFKGPIPGVTNPFKGLGAFGKTAGVASLLPLLTAGVDTVFGSNLSENRGVRAIGEGGQAALFGSAARTLGTSAFSSVLASEGVAGTSGLAKALGIAKNIKGVNPVSLALALGAGAFSLTSANNLFGTVTGKDKPSPFSTLSSDVTGLLGTQTTLGFRTNSVKNAATLASLGLGIGAGSAFAIGTGGIAAASGGVIGTLTTSVLTSVSNSIIDAISSSDVNKGFIASKLGDVSSTTLDRVTKSISDSGFAKNLKSEDLKGSAEALTAARENIQKNILPTISDPEERERVIAYLGELKRNIYELQGFSGVIKPLDPDFITKMEKATKKAEKFSDQIKVVEKELSNADIESRKLGEDIFVANAAGDFGTARGLQSQKKALDEKAFRQRKSQIGDLRKSNLGALNEILKLTREKESIEKTIEAQVNEGQTSLLDRAGIASRLSPDALSSLKSSIDQSLKATDQETQKTAEDNVIRVFQSLGLPKPKDFLVAVKEYRDSLGKARGRVAEIDRTIEGDKDKKIKGLREASNQATQLVNTLATKQIGDIQSRIAGVSNLAESGAISPNEEISRINSILSEGINDPAINSMDEFRELVDQANKRVLEYSDNLRQVGLAASLTAEQQKKYNSALKLFDQIRQDSIDTPIKFGNFTTGQQLTASLGVITSLQNRLAASSAEFNVNQQGRNDLGEVVKLGGTEVYADIIEKTDKQLEIQSQLNDEVAKAIDLKKQQIQEEQKLLDTQQQVAQAVLKYSQTLKNVAADRQVSVLFSNARESFRASLGLKPGQLQNRFSVQAEAALPNTQRLELQERNIRSARERQQQKEQFDLALRQNREQQKFNSESVKDLSKLRKFLGSSSRALGIAENTKALTGRTTEQTASLIQNKVSVGDPAFLANSANRSLELRLEELGLISQRIEELSKQTGDSNKELYQLEVERVGLLKEEKELIQDLISAESDRTTKRLNSQQNITRAIAGRELSPTEQSVFAIQRLNNLFSEFSRLQAQNGTTRAQLEDVGDKIATELINNEKVLPAGVLKTFRRRLSSINRQIVTAPTTDELFELKNRRRLLSENLATNQSAANNIAKELGISSGELKSLVSQGLREDEIAKRLNIPLQTLKNLVDRQNLKGFDTASLTAPEIFDAATRRFEAAVAKFSTDLTPKGVVGDSKGTVQQQVNAAIKEQQTKGTPIRSVEQQQRVNAITGGIFKAGAAFLQGANEASEGIARTNPTIVTRAGNGKVGISSKFRGGLVNPQEVAIDNLSFNIADLNAKNGVEDKGSAQVASSEKVSKTMVDFGKMLGEKMEANNRYAKETVNLLASLLSNSTPQTSTETAKEGDTTNISQGKVTRWSDGFSSSANKYAATGIVSGMA